MCMCWWEVGGLFCFNNFIFDFFSQGLWIVLLFELQMFTSVMFFCRLQWRHCHSTRTTLALPTLCPRWTSLPLPTSLLVRNSLTVILILSQAPQLPHLRTRLKTDLDSVLVAPCGLHGISTLYNKCYTGWWWTVALIARCSRLTPPKHNGNAWTSQGAASILSTPPDLSVWTYDSLNSAVRLSELLSAQLHLQGGPGSSVIDFSVASLGSVTFLACYGRVCAWSESVDLTWAWFRK